eukprot:Polyplicarium_translucidae@DN3227_c0_g1_i3.p1
MGWCVSQLFCSHHRFSSSVLNCFCLSSALSPSHELCTERPAVPFEESGRSWLLGIRQRRRSICLADDSGDAPLADQALVLDHRRPHTVRQRRPPWLQILWLFCLRFLVDSFLWLGFLS